MLNGLTERKINVCPQSSCICSETIFLCNNKIFLALRGLHVWVIFFYWYWTEMCRVYVRAHGLGVVLKSGGVSSLASSIARASFTNSHSRASRLSRTGRKSTNMHVTALTTEHNGNVTDWKVRTYRVARYATNITLMQCGCRNLRECL